MFIAGTNRPIRDIKIYTLTYNGLIPTDDQQAALGVYYLGRLHLTVALSYSGILLTARTAEHTSFG